MFNDDNVFDEDSILREQERERQEMEARHRAQREELRRIREEERRKLNPDLDSAFATPDEDMVRQQQMAREQELARQQAEHERQEAARQREFERQKEIAYQKELARQQEMEYQRAMEREQIEAEREQARQREEARRREMAKKEEMRRRREEELRKAQKRNSIKRVDDAYEADFEPEYDDDDDYDDDYEYERPRRERRPREDSRERRRPSGSGHSSGHGSGHGSNPPHKKKKKKKWKKVLFALLAILLVLCLLFVAAVHRITSKFNHIDTDVSKAGANLSGNTVNILLIGQDARDGQEGQRADTMMLMTINRKANSVVLTSFMRDMYIDIPGYGGNRINAAYAYGSSNGGGDAGGVNLLDQTLEQNFGVEIDGNAMVDFDGFLEAMTAVGDLDIELNAEEAQYMNENPGFGSNNDESDEVWELHEGMNSLTSNQALAYSRIRYVGNSDWERTERQRKVIMAAVNKVKHGNLVAGYKAADKAAPYITTDLNTMGMIRVGLGIMFNGEMQSYRIPVDGTYYNDNINGMAVLVPDLAANKDYLEKYMSGTYEEE